METRASPRVPCYDVFQSITGRREFGGAPWKPVRIMTDSLRVNVPATTANMGPGFDCLAMALDIWNTVTVEPGEGGFEISGHGADTLKRDRSNLVVRSFSVPFERSGKTAPRARFTCENGIPLARGLGSSSAAVVAGLVAGNELCGRPLAEAELLDLAVEIEGHPDNVSAALLGGCQIVIGGDSGYLASSVPVPEGLKAVIYVPETSMPTNLARGLLSQTVERQDAVYNIGRVGLLVRAFATGDLSGLAMATEDRLHQPARLELFPPMKVIIRAAVDAGALGAFLSGAGSSIVALAKGREVTIGYEMAEAASKAGVNGTFLVTQPTEQGAQVVDSG